MATAQAYHHGLRGSGAHEHSAVRPAHREHATAQSYLANDRVANPTRTTMTVVHGAV
jgi:hypothetical protein